MRGREQVENMRANRQTRELNDLRLQSERDRIAQDAMARGQDEKLKQAFSSLLKQSGGNVDLAQQEANRQYPDYALPLNEAFAKLRGSSPDPMKKREQQMGLQSDQAEMTKNYVVPMVKKFLELPEGDRLEQFGQFNNFLNQNFGFQPPQEWVEQGYTPDVGQQLQQMTGIADSQKPFITFDQRKELEQMKQSGMDRRSGQTNKLRKIDLALKDKSISMQEKKLLRENRLQEMELKSKLDGLENSVFKLEKYEDDAREIYDNEALWKNTGVGKGWASIPGSGPADIKSKLGFIVNNLVVDAVAEAKKSGVTFGAMTESEWAQMKNAVANLDPNQSPEQFRKGVGDLLERIERAKAMAQKEIGLHEEFLFGGSRSYNPDDFWSK
jgi:hypothetical protein